MEDIEQLVLQAEQRIKSYVKQTPLSFSRQLSKKLNCNVYLKLENLQHTCSFKVRGAFSKILSLTESERQCGIVVASSGNHGAGVAYALDSLGLHGKIFVPESCATSKMNTIKSYDVELIVHGKEMGETEAYARAYAKEHHKSYVSPYNDYAVIGGQGTIGLELLEQLKSIDAVFIAVGGGGLIAGIGGFLKKVHPDIKVIGCLPENSPVMAKSVDVGKIIDCEIKPTLSDGTAGNLDHNTVTFAYNQTFVDEYVLVSEQEIIEAMRQFIEAEHMLLEGAAGVALAGVGKKHHYVSGKNIVVIICGANIALKNLAAVVCDL